MQFKIFGPYEIPLHEGQADWIDTADIKNFWEHVESKKDGLSEACGVYIFGMNGDPELRKTVAARTLPWYVGKAEKQPFKKECITPRNQGMYNEVIRPIYNRRGTPFLYLLARIESDGEFSRHTEDKYPGVAFVEKMIIQNALAVNTKILNNQFTRDAKNTLINGILNSKGTRLNRVNDFKKMLNIANLEPIELTQDKAASSLRRFDIYGPYEVPQNKSKKIITPDDVTMFWSDVVEVDKKAPSLKKQYGVYVFVLKHGNNFSPWFVGSSENVGFDDLVLSRFDDLVLSRYNDVYQINNILEKTRGTPYIYFLPFVDKNMQIFRKNIPPRPPVSNLRFVKTVLFEYGVQANSKILSDDPNESDIWKDLYVQGLVNATRGDSTLSVRKLKQLLNIA